MSRSKSSHRWLKEHFADPYVKQAQQEGYRSRAVYKLLEIQEKDVILKRGMTVVDLGAAPGGWSQLAARLIGSQGHLFALDILPMEPLDNVICIQGDFQEAVIVEQLKLSIHHGKEIDLVISDMAPNMSGVTVVDQARMMCLAESALLFAQQVLKLDGDFLVKIFQGAGFDNFLRELRHTFKKVTIRKPQASRARSAEVYLLARGYKNS